MNFSLTPELEKVVQAKVKSGPCNSAYETTRAARLEEFRSEIDRRLASLDRGQGLDGAQVFDRIREKSEQRRKKRA